MNNRYLVFAIDGTLTPNGGLNDYVGVFPTLVDIPSFLNKMDFHLPLMTEIHILDMKLQTFVKFDVSNIDSILTQLFSSSEEELFELEWEPLDPD